MPAKRIKEPEAALPEVPVPQTLAEAEALTQALVDDRIEQERLIASRDEMIQQMTAGIADKLGKLQNRERAGIESLRVWALANKREFGTDKSIVLRGHRVGWRTGNFKTATIRKFTWAKVLAAIKEIGGEALTFLRTKEEADKERMIACRTTHAELLAKIGVQVTQDETFGITPNREGQEGPAITAGWLLLFALASLGLGACASTQPPAVPVPAHRTPAATAPVLRLKNGTAIRSRDDAAALAKRLPGSRISTKDGMTIWDLGGGILDGRDQRGDGGQSEKQEPLFRAYTPLVVRNGFVRRAKNAATFYAPQSGLERVTFLTVGEDAVATAEGARDFRVVACEFLNTRNGDKSVQLNEARGALLEDNLIYSGRTAVRVFESSFTPRGATATARGNRIIGADTGFHVSTGTLRAEGNEFTAVRLPVKLVNNATILP